MAQVLAAVATFEKVKGAYDSMRGGDPGVAPLSDAASVLGGPAQAPDMSQGGFAMANPNPTMAPPVASDAAPAAEVPQAVPQQTAPQQPVDNPYAADTAKEIAGSIGDNGGDDVTVTGDRFKPKHESALGVIGDFLMMRRGMQPIFRQRTEQANLKEAMKGFQRDPDAAISRVRQVDPELAFKMQSQMTGNRANEALEQERRASMQDKGIQRIGGMLGAVSNSKDPNAIYQKTLPTMRRWAESYGMDPNTLPDQYDPDILSGLRAGAISPYQQEGLGIRQEAVDNTEQYRSSSLGSLNAHRQATEAETQRHNLVIENKPSAAHSKPVARNVFGNGGRFAGTVAPDGRKAVLQGEDGQWYAYRLKTPGDISSRVRSPGEDAAARKAMGITDE